MKARAVHMKTALCAMLGLDVADVDEFLDDLVTSRLAYEENGHSLALPLPARLPEHG